MKLFYYKGQNFGDAINPLLLSKLFPGFFDEDETEIFIGIGSILGWIKLPDGCQKAIIFSSGYADNQESTYGKPPQIDDRFDVICVRGKRTALKLGIPIEKAISDGALLLPVIFPCERKKSEKISFMPHHGTLDMYPQWKKIADACDIELIDPAASDPFSVIEKICLSKKVIAEAMHGAIAADAYRIPWIPVVTTKLINTFKWRDYLESVHQEYKPLVLPTLYSKAIIQKVVSDKLKRVRLAFLSKPLAALFYAYQQLFRVPGATRMLRRISLHEPLLCSGEILQTRQKQLLDCVDLIKAKYSKRS